MFTSKKAKFTSNPENSHSFSRRKATASDGSQKKEVLQEETYYVQNMTIIANIYSVT